MKKIGYIHRYNDEQEKGILVYGNVERFRSDTHSPSLFTKSQCKSPVKTGELVYFHIDEDGTITNIETASIFNFDRELIMSYASCDDEKGWDDYWGAAHIKYIDIYKLKEWVPYEERSRHRNSRFSRRDDDDDLEWREKDKKEEGKNGEYHTITIPNSVEDELELFKKPIPTETHYDGHFFHYSVKCTIVDTLNPSLWIPSNIKSGQYYYGKNITEFNDLFDIFVSTRKQAEKKNNTASNNCISKAWTQLLERLSEADVIEAYTSHNILQPVLPMSFCENHLSLLNKKLGFPSIAIAESFLIDSINNVVSATDFDCQKAFLDSLVYSDEKHLSDEGVFLCSISNERLQEMSMQLLSRLPNVLSYIKKQIDKALPKPRREEIQFINSIDSTQMLEIGKFYDIIWNFIDSEAEGKFSFFFKKEYDKLPESYHFLFDIFLKEVLPERIKSLLIEGKLNPFGLHYITLNASIWLPNCFIEDNLATINSVFSNIQNINDLTNAYRYHYIQEELFVKKYYPLATSLTDNDCLSNWQDTSVFGYDTIPFPDEIQLYIINRVLKGRKLCVYSYGPSYYSFTQLVKISSINDFLYWLNENTCTESKPTNPITESVASQLRSDILSKLTDEQLWALFEQDLITSPGESNIKTRLTKGYENHDLKDKFFDKDCFQKQMASDVLTADSIYLIQEILDRLNSLHRREIANQLTSFAKLYEWSKDPKGAVDWDELTLHFFELPAENMKVVFMYLFYDQVKKDASTVSGFLNRLSDLISFTKSRLAEHAPTLYVSAFFSSKNVLGAIEILTEILKKKHQSPDGPFSYNEIWPLPLNGIPKIANSWILQSLKEFFYTCFGWHLMGNYCDENSELRHGYVVKEVDDRINETNYRVIFYELPLGNDGYDFFDFKATIRKCISQAEAVLKKNFKYEYEGNKGYLISSKDIIRLKEYVKAFRIDDKCNLFNEKTTYNDRNGIERFPTYLNVTRVYKKQKFPFCNCGTFMDEDPAYGIPFRWCKKLPCAKGVQFLRADADWKSFKFADLLWIVLRDKIDLSQLWSINSYVASFINAVATSDADSLNDIVSHPLKSEDEVGEWTSEMSIMKSACHGYEPFCLDDEQDDDYPDEDDYEDCEDSYSHYGNSDSHYEGQTYDRYNGSYVQDEMGYSDDDIDTIFDGDPGAYWNID